MRTDFTRKDIAELMQLAYDDVERQLFYAIKKIPEERATLLSQLDVLVKVKERLDARIEYDNPCS
jgi:hypothetical protein